MPAPVRKAVIPMAGLGTRFRPITHVVPKEFLPIGNKPLFHYIVQEALDAGCDEVICVVRPGRDFATPYVEATKLDVKITLAYQEVPGGLGQAVGCASKAVGNEPFLVLLPDVLIEGPQNVCQQLRSCYEAENGASVIAVREEPENALQNYGIIAPQEQRGTTIVVNDLVEKPAPGTAPSNFAIVGRYLLSASIFEILQNTPPGAKDEVQLTDALKTLAQQETLLALAYQETAMFDAGTPPGWLEANNYYAA